MSMYSSHAVTVGFVQPKHDTEGTCRISAVVRVYAATREDAAEIAADAFARLLEDQIEHRLVKRD